ncbi:DUF3168 domain-containing protein [Streptomyces sp. NPDC093111]|uniref:DUF3168 domain-containing protein n=1 Tax=Streptomyces sp. NPDC093111 TaxID=3154978 RepID=UPI003423767D
MTAAADPLLPIQGALVQALRADTELSMLISGVYDYLPEEAGYPFVVVGEALGIPDNAHDRYGQETSATLHVWSQYRGYSQGLKIGARITAVLDHQPLTIPGHDHVVTRWESTQTLTDPEPPGNIRHVVLRYRIVTEQPPA